jgi:hypothetical protein
VEGNKETTSFSNFRDYYTDICAGYLGSRELVRDPVFSNCIDSGTLAFCALKKAGGCNDNEGKTLCRYSCRQCGCRDYESNCAALALSDIFSPGPCDDVNL